MIGCLAICVTKDIEQVYLIKVPGECMFLYFLGPLMLFLLGVEGHMVVAVSGGMVDREGVVR